MQSLLFAGLATTLGFTSVAVLLWLSPRQVKRPIVSYMLASMEKGGREKDCRTWEESVHEHSDLEPIGESGRCWVVHGTLPQPGPKFTRAMTIFKAEDDTLTIHSPVCLNKETMEKLLALGEITRIIVPSPAHRLDATQYHHRFPDAKILCPRTSREPVQYRAPVNDSVESEFGVFTLGDDEKTLGKPGSIKCITLPQSSGFNQEEVMYVVRTGDKSSVLVVCDFFFNLNPETVDGFTKFIGSGSGFGVTSTGMIMANDVKGTRVWVEEVLTPICVQLNVEAIVVAHGDAVIGTELVKSKLSEAAMRLS